jgi:hypothetical protein
MSLTLPANRRRPELLVEWSGLDRSYLKWVHRDVLLDDVPDLVRAYEANPSAFRARPSALKRATTGQCCAQALRVLQRGARLDGCLGVCGRGGGCCGGTPRFVSLFPTFLYVGSESLL